jgi:hypothetical protein
VLPIFRFSASRTEVPVNCVSVLDAGAMIRSRATRRSRINVSTTSVRRSRVQLVGRPAPVEVGAPGQAAASAEPEDPPPAVAACNCISACPTRSSTSRAPVRHPQSPSSIGFDPGRDRIQNQSVAHAVKKLIPNENLNETVILP